MAERGTLKFEHDLGADGVCVPSFGTLSLVIAISEAKNRQKVDNFEPVHLGNYQN